MNRMDKYADETPELKRRVDKYSGLYESNSSNDYDKFDVDSNVSVLKDNARSIDVDQIREMLDKKYRDNIPKRKWKKQHYKFYGYEDIPVFNKTAEDEKIESENGTKLKMKTDKKAKATEETIEIKEKQNSKNSKDAKANKNKASSKVAKNDNSENKKG